MSKLKIADKLPSNYQELTSGLISRNSSHPKAKDSKQPAEIEKARSISKSKAADINKGITKMYADHFDSNKLGGFDKVLVARKISEQLDDNIDISSETMENFDKLFSNINEIIKQNKP